MVARGWEERIATEVNTQEAAQLALLTGSIQITRRSCVNPTHWSISLRRKSLPNEIRVSEFKCTSEGCKRPSLTMTRPGLCAPCKQREKRKRRQERLENNTLCRLCGSRVERRGAPSDPELCSDCRNMKK